MSESEERTARAIVARDTLQLVMDSAAALSCELPFRRPTDSRQLISLIHHGCYTIDVGRRTAFEFHALAIHGVPEVSRQAGAGSSDHVAFPRRLAGVLAVGVSLHGPLVCGTLIEAVGPLDAIVIVIPLISILAPATCPRVRQ